MANIHLIGFAPNTAGGHGRAISMLMRKLGHTDAVVTTHFGTTVVGCQSVKPEPYFSVEHTSLEKARGVALQIREVIPKVPIEIKLIDQFLDVEVSQDEPPAGYGHEV